MSIQNKAISPKEVDEQSADSTKKLNTLPGAQLPENTADDIDEPSSDILPQQDLKISSDLAQTTIDRLAKLSELEYELERTEIAKSLNNMSVRSLDKLVKKAKNKIESKISDNLVSNTEPYTVSIRPSHLFFY